MYFAHSTGRGRTKILNACLFKRYAHSAGPKTHQKIVKQPMKNLQKIVKKSIKGGAEGADRVWEAPKAPTKYKGGAEGADQGKEAPKAPIK